LHSYEKAVEDLGQARHFEATVNGKTEVSRELDRVKSLLAAGEGDYNANSGAGMQLEPNW
jgi:hypothetical protein